jgi:hypothetical protein
VATHQLDDTDTVHGACRLDVSASDHLDRGGKRRLESEASIDEVDVVVDRLRDADDSDRETAPLDFADELHRAAECAVAADDEEHPDAELFQTVDHVFRGLLASRRTE